MRPVTFITGNQSKADYFSKLMGLAIPHTKLELDELQSLDLKIIVSHKARQAYSVLKSPVLVEDVSLEFNALNGLPGPFIKFFVENAGVAACCKLLDGFTDRSALIRCNFGYFDGTTERQFSAVSKGTISTEPRGVNGYGFDQIFICDGYDVTRAEMDPELNEQTYRDTMKPFSEVKQFLTSL